MLYRGLLGVYREDEIETMTDLRDKRRDLFDAYLQKRDWGELLPEPYWHSWAEIGSKECGRGLWQGA
jgi:hypothetical protein